MNRRHPAYALFIGYNGVLRHASGLDEPVLAFVREVKAAGRPVVVCTNAPDVDLTGHEDQFDHVVTAAEVGWPMPSKPFFQAACAAVDVEARRCLLVDDTDRNVRGARDAGLVAMRLTAPTDLPYALRALGLPTDDA